jgi:hypothetical protein
MTGKRRRKRKAKGFAFKLDEKLLRRWREHAHEIIGTRPVNYVLIRARAREGLPGQPRDRSVVAAHRLGDGPAAFAAGQAVQCLLLLVVAELVYCC